MWRRRSGRRGPQIALAITLTLAMRPIGAVIFGLMADRYGRRLPLMINVIFYAVISVLCGLAPSYAVVHRAAHAVRHRHGRRMGRRRVARARVGLAARMRGLLSGLLQEGYALGNLLAALAFRTVYPLADCALSRQRLAGHVLHRRPAGAAVAVHPRARQGVRGVARAPDRLADLPRSLLAALAAVPLSRAADDDDEFHVARHAGHVSDAAGRCWVTARRGSPTSRCSR